MNKTILLTGATDGIGLETAKRLAADGHTLLIHGRSDAKLRATAELLSQIPGASAIVTQQADLSRLEEVKQLATALRRDYETLDVLINNAGVYEVANPLTPEGDDVRFVVNTIAPYLLTQELLPLMPATGRVINLSSAAQAPVDLAALDGQRRLGASDAYAQSKLACTMWTFHLAQHWPTTAPSIIAVNPASLLGSKMVKEAYGMAGKDLSIGADILCRAALSDEFEGITGRYFDNDRQQFSQPHPDALDPNKNAAVVAAIEAAIGRLSR
ncbi:MAG: SDR family NAD(P)-dependent oxidoreductase [Pseudomonadota bacterium]